MPDWVLLYLIRVLHQTTTVGCAPKRFFELYLIRVLHQTTTHTKRSVAPYCCILFVFYIKPQLMRTIYSTRGVVSYSCSTSNHNLHSVAWGRVPVVSYSCSTSNHNLRAFDCERLRGCILFVFYIKPQLFTFLYFNSIRCILFVFYIKPQQLVGAQRKNACCILFVFYIKPQLGMIFIFFG